jgi:hypothetical protein
LNEKLTLRPQMPQLSMNPQIDPEEWMRQLSAAGGNQPLRRHGTFKVGAPSPIQTNDARV